MSQKPWFSRSSTLGLLALLLATLLWIPGHVAADKIEALAEPRPPADVLSADAFTAEVAADIAVDASIEPLAPTLKDEGRCELAGYIYCGDPCGQEGTYGACVQLRGGYPLYVLCECSQGTWSCFGSDD